jgi:hypothetical protein
MGISWTDYMNLFNKRMISKLPNTIIYVSRWMYIRCSMTSNNIFAVDVATNRLVLSDVAPKGGKYRCSDGECGAPVFLKRGDVIAAHFAHYPGADGARCPGKNGGETREHFECKHHVAKYINDYQFWKGGCGRCSYMEFYDISDCTAHVEATVPGSNRKADVLLSRVGKTPSIIEIFHTHAVDDEKRTEMNALNVPIIEVTTASVRSAIKFPNSTGAKFTARTTDFTQVNCSTCRDAAVQVGLADAKLHDKRPPGKRKWNNSKRTGKCKMCQEWMFENDIKATQLVYNEKFTEKQWDDLFVHDPPQYKMAYSKPDGRVRLCGYCAAMCNCCGDMMAVEHMARFGICLPCSKGISSQRLSEDDYTRLSECTYKKKRGGSSKRKRGWASDILTQTRWTDRDTCNGLFIDA